MHNRPKSEMQSACIILQEMLRHPAIKQTHTIGGGAGISTSGQVIFNSSDSFDTYDADSNALLRAKFACEQNMVVSPLSKARMFYTTTENFPSELEEVQRKTEQEASKAKDGWISKFRRGFSK